MTLPIRLPDGVTPWPHQIQAFEFARPRKATMLAVGMGGGKGAIAIALAEDDQAQRVLILCPKSVVGVWPRQLSSDHAEDLDDVHALRPWQVWAGQAQGARGPLRNPSVAQRAAALVHAYTAAIRMDQPFAAVVNFEAAPMGQMADLLLGTPWDLVIIDESHRIKAPGGKQSRYIARLCERVRNNGGRILALTGTPMPHSPLDLYGQYRALNPTIFGTSHASFRLRYGQRKILRVDAASGEAIYLTGPKGQPIYDGLRQDRADEFAQRAGRIMFQVRQEDLDQSLGLAEPVDTYRTCQLEPATRRVYEQLERDLIADIDGGVVTAANAMVLVLRLAQATSGFARNADTGHIARLADPPEKARLLADILEDLDQREPVVVFARFHEDLDQIRRVAEQQGRRYGELSGRRRDGLTGQSRMASGVDVLGCQLQSGGVGIDLTRARYGIYYSLDFKLADAQQSRKRLHRPGQARRVTYVHLLAENTVDRAVYGALRRREEIVNAVLDRLKQGAMP